MSITFVRVLYGDGTGWPRPKDDPTGEHMRARSVRLLNQDIDRSFQNDRDNFFRDKIHYVTMGEWATDKLRTHKVKNIHQVNKHPWCQPKGYIHFWHKLYLVREALRLFGDVVCTDFDCVPTDGFDARFGEAVDSMEGKIFQAPLTIYHRRAFAWRESSGEGWSKVSKHIGLCGSFMLFRNVGMVNEFFEDWEELNKLLPNNTMASDQAITYSLEKRRRIKTVRETYEECEPEAIIIPRSPIHDLGITKDSAIFSHR
ncbi:hypothetical protein LCGC14_0249470 [marine sediment metagenome]|uniref:Nucleotide-diphospho-sugar transferase domain-containing protein n=1 Tax=marine sediment metagenome TaxID=412755 RepID=A0A0F9U9T4_9ZZZZ